MRLILFTLIMLLVVTAMAALGILMYWFWAIIIVTLVVVVVIWAVSTFAWLIFEPIVMIAWDFAGNLTRRD